MSNPDAPPRRQFVITVLARDRVGIIAEVSRVISALEGDIADLRESVLRGYLNMMLLATFPASQALDVIRQRLLALNAPGALPMEIVVHPADDALPPAPSDIPHLNILDLSTAVSEGAYIMILLVDLSHEDVAGVRRQLQAFSQETGLRLMLQHYTIFKATNEVSLL
jgi:predicted amino acid-binding ACT domain protein